MIWALLALLGIPIWFIVVVLGTSISQRRQVINSNGIFSYKLRTEKGWSRGKSFARWVSDVMIRHKGIALIRTEANQVIGVEMVSPVGDPIKGLEDDPIELAFTLVAADPIRIAVAAVDVETATGPFVKAHQ